MSCTTHKVTLRDPIQDVKRIKYENLLLKIRIKQVKPAIAFKLTPQSQYTAMNKQPSSNYGKKLKISQDNATLLKRILNLEGRVPIYGKIEDQKHLDRFCRNQQAMKKMSKKFIEGTRNKENELLRRRLRAIRPTIDVKKMNKDAKLRDKILKNMSRYRKKKKSEIDLKRLQVKLNVATERFPKTGRKKKVKPLKLNRANTAR